MLRPMFLVSSHVKVIGDVLNTDKDRPLKLSEEILPKRLVENFQNVVGDHEWAQPQRFTSSAVTDLIAGPP